MAASKKKTATLPTGAFVKKAKPSPKGAPTTITWASRLQGCLKMPLQAKTQSSLHSFATGAGSTVNIFPQPGAIRITRSRIPALTRAGYKLAIRERRETTAMRKRVANRKQTVDE